MEYHCDPTHIVVVPAVVVTFDLCTNYCENTTNASHMTIRPLMGTSPTGNSCGGLGHMITNHLYHVTG